MPSPTRRFAVLCRSVRGSSTTLTLSLIGVIGLASLFLMEAIFQQQKASQTMEHKLIAAIIRSNFENILRDDLSWESTKNAASNGTLACLRNGTSCSVGGSSRVIPWILMANGAVFYRWDESSRGLSGEGQPCNAFNEISSDGSRNCPFRPEVTWGPICTGACINPQVVLKFELKYSAPGLTPLKTQSYSFSITRSP